MSHQHHGFEINGQLVMPVRVMANMLASNMEYFPMFFRNAGKSSKDRFEVNLDVHEYGPDDIRVKTVDGFVIVRGKHEEKQEDHGWVERKFHRRCPLPKGYTTKALLSEYSSDGMLTITANLVKVGESECDIPIKKKDDNEKSDPEPVQPKTDQPEPDQSEPDVNQSEKKPVKPKKERMVEVKVDMNPKPSYVIDYGLGDFLDFKEIPIEQQA